MDTLSLPLPPPNEPALAHTTTPSIVNSQAGLASEQQEEEKRKRQKNVYGFVTVPIDWEPTAGTAPSAVHRAMGRRLCAVCVGQSQVPPVQRHAGIKV